MPRRLLLLSIAPLLFACATHAPAPSPRMVGGIVRNDHHVLVASNAPGMGSGEADIYVREVSWPGVRSEIPADRRVVLFVHGSGTPSEVAFDVPYADYSWMEYLARAGFDAFAMDMTGYGRSTRPPAMNDACNFPRAQQAQFVPVLIAAPCAPSHPTAITTLESDWRDIGAVVDYLRRERGVEKVALVGWSQGGPRIAGYVLRNPGKVSRIFALAPSYAPDMAGTPPDPGKALDGPMGAQSRDDFTRNWDRQAGCAGQYEPAAHAAIWQDMLASDPIAATWGPGVRRAPNVASWGFDRAAAAKLTVPFAMATGQHDKQVAPERVAALYRDLGAPDKVFIDLACSSHNAMWEKNHLLLFKASAEWLRDGRVNALTQGKLRLGY
jgi:pimeloyl-ACP methyl ester carboxylesterase